MNQHLQIIFYRLYFSCLVIDNIQRCSNIFRVGALTIFAVLAGSAGLAVFGLPDTTGIPTPNTAKEVIYTQNTYLKVLE